MRQARLDWIKIGRKVRIYRKKNGLSLRKANFEPSAVWRIEHGLAVKAVTLIRLAKAIGIKDLSKFIIPAKTGPRK